MRSGLLVIALLCSGAGPASEPASEPATISFAFVGDVMLGSTFPDETGGSLPPDDGAHILDPVAPILGAVDIAFGNLEGPLVDAGVSVKCGPKAGAAKPRRKTGRPSKNQRCYAFRVPTRYGRYLQAAGFDVMSLANNHGMDFGEDGRRSSMQVLDDLGIAHSGPIGDIAYLNVRGTRVAVIAFATYPNAYDLNDLDAARAAVTEAANRSDIVVVSFHGGAEGATRTHVPYGPELFLNENRGDLRTFTHAMIDAGAALVIGHGPHVVRGFELYQGRLIAYSLGNFATYGGMNLHGLPGISLILRVRIDSSGRFLDGAIDPIVQPHPGGPQLDPERQAIPLLQRLSHEDFDAAAPEITSSGEIHPR